MSNSIHPLQEAAVHLLNALYRDKHLAVTPAILTIQNGYYPSVQAILETLRRYENEDLVVSFVEDNSELVKEAEEYVAAEQLQRETAANNNRTEQPPFDDIFRAFQEAEPFELLKEVPLSEIESAFSKALTELCGKELCVSINRMENEDSWARKVNLQLDVVVKGTRNNHAR